MTFTFTRSVTVFAASTSTLRRTLHVGLDDDQQFLDFTLTERFDTALGRLQQCRLRLNICDVARSTVPS
jgi:hypothetical protein